MSVFVFAGLCGGIARADNVLLLIADDFGVDSCGLYVGSGAAPTPNIDALAANGVRFTEFWANPICSPTRAAILTGRHGFRTGVGSPTGNFQIPLGEYTIADAVIAAGYHAACIGKWHLGGNTNGRAMNPNLMGFTDYMGSTGGGVPDYFSWSKTVNGVTDPNTNYVTSETVDDAVAWIDSKGSDPWFCWVAFNAPHTPFHLPPSELHSYDTLSGTTQDIDANPLPYYQAMVEALDSEIGRLLDTIDDDVLAETTVIFVGDNGTPGQVANNFERGNKGQLFQGGVHVPCVVSGAAVAGPLGRTNDAMLHVSDLFATIAELCGVNLESELPDGVFVDSVSFAPYLSEPDLPSFHTIQFAERFTVDGANQDGKTVRNYRYKLIRLDNGNVRFYDLQTDPLEATNLQIGTGTGPRATNYNALNAYLDGLLASPAAPQVASIEVDDASGQRSTVTSLTIDLDSPASVDLSGASPILLVNRGTNEEVPHSLSAERIDGKTRLTVEILPGNSTMERADGTSTLDDGNYVITFDSAAVQFDGKNLDANGDGIGGDDVHFGEAAEDGLFRFYGDTDGDRDVDGVDYFQFAQTFFRRAGQAGFNPALDYDGDGDVDGTEYGQFVARFFRTLGF